MPSTENTTLQRIQREISDVLEREKELRHSYSQQDDTVTNNNDNNNSEHEHNNNITRQESSVKPILQQSKSMSALNGVGINGTNGTKNGLRLFVTNPATKGVMHKFIKARGKINTVSGFQPSSSQVQQLKVERQKSWNIPDTLELPKATEPGLYVRKGYVPVQVKMQKELEDLYHRERELRSERRKTHASECSDDDNLDNETPQFGAQLKPARSLAQLYDLDEYRNEFNSSLSNLKQARSLAELCDASEDELETPGSHSLIMKWEELIQKNQERC